MPCIDLHIHSFYSDGSLSPKDLLKLGRHHGLHAMALTDHDTIEGVAELQQLGQDAGMTIISGVDREAFAARAGAIADAFPEWSDGLYDRARAIITGN